MKSPRPGLRTVSCGALMLLLSAGAFLSVSVHAEGKKRDDGKPSAGENILPALRRLPGGERRAWENYLNTSDALRRREEKVLEAELKREDRSKALMPKAGSPFRIPARPPEWFGSGEARKMAQAVISFQTPSGGWTKNLTMTKRPRRKGERWSPWAPWHYVATIDNGATTGQLLFLAKVHAASGDDACKKALLLGLDYLLTAQMPSGGWPQVFPLEGSYHDSITFNDEAMIRVLDLLQDVARRRTPWKFADDGTVKSARSAVSRGISCILEAQIKVEGRRTAWCAQHQPVTLAPAKARIYEKPSISGSESVGIVRFLMSLDDPEPSVIQAVESAVKWFRDSRINPQEYGIRAGVPGWARFYDIETNRPIFSDMDGKIRPSLKGVKKKRKTYSWFTTIPDQLISRDYPAWRKRTGR